MCGHLATCYLLVLSWCHRKLVIKICRFSVLVCMTWFGNGICISFEKFTLMKPTANSVTVTSVDNWIWSGCTFITAGQVQGCCWLQLNVQRRTTAHICRWHASCLQCTDSTVSIVFFTSINWSVVDVPPYNPATRIWSAITSLVINKLLPH